MLLFLGVSALVIATPGQDTALTIRNTLLGSRATGVATALGVGAARPPGRSRRARSRCAARRVRPPARSRAPVMEHVRVDKWLWAARLYKTRSLATDAVLGGRVKLNGVRVKPAKEVRVDDTIEASVGTVQRTVVVTGISEKRGPAKVAATLYAETPESIAKREQQAAERRLARPLGADLGARPTKLDRRRLDALRRSQRRG